MLFTQGTDGMLNKNILLAITLALALTGCSFNCKEQVNVCPKPVLPSQYVMDKFHEFEFAKDITLRDKKLTEFWWQQRKQYRSLKACNSK